MAPPRLRIVFLGSDGIALPMLEWLAGEGRACADLVAVFTQPDRPAGRGLNVGPNAVKSWALGQGLPVFQPERLRDPEQAILAGLSADLALVMAYGHILRDAFLAQPRLGTVNLHASLLPRFRGASPIQAAIAAGERETGVSLMRLVRELDAGPVADRETVPIGGRDTAAEVSERLAHASARLLARTLPRLAGGRLEFVEQDAAQASYCRKLAREDGALDFAAPAAELAARVNALHPWPGCAVPIAGQAIRLGLAEAASDGGPGAPGTVLGSDAEALRVQTGTGVLRLLRLQRPGGRMLEAPQFLRGFAVPTGERLPSRPMTPLVRR